jgi:phage shock protein PspC (stress-responsive transcriptional regulator)
MNKTVNINLAGIFFHIDENAYSKLQRYLDAIKRSFTDSQGRSEILMDIEARIAELFNERIKDEKQVITIDEVDEVIAIMGQPEDYIVDEEMFEDEPSPRQTASSTRKLFRDTDNAYVGGVSAGLGHYFGIDPLWVRLAWIVLVLGLGTGVLIYILLWILMPAAESTADKLAMSGKPVNITNIEQKVKEGFSNVKDSIEDVADKVKNKDYSKVGNKVQSTSRSFFEALGSIIIFFFTVIAKFVGVILIIVGASTVISLIIALLSLGVADIFHFPGIHFGDIINSTNLPIWLVSILTLFAVGIPFFYLFILGLKILVTNLKSLGKIANFSLLGIWLASVITLTTFAAREVTEFAREASVTQKQEINIATTDTVYVKMVGNEVYSNDLHRDYDFDILRDENNEKHLYSSNVKLIFKSTMDSLARVSVEKNARGNNYQNAKERAEGVEYEYSFDNDELLLNGYFLSDVKHKFRDQEVAVTLYLPEGSIVYLDDNTYSFHRNYSGLGDIIDNGFEEHYLKVVKDDVICLDCTDEEKFRLNIDIGDDDAHFKLDKNGLRIKGDEVKISIDGKSASGEGEEVKAVIDSSGISIKNKDN